MAAPLRSAASKATGLTAKTVHIKIHPTTRTISERRQVLRILSKFGDVEFFKSLKVSLSFRVGFRSPPRGRAHLLLQTHGE
jgi:hypothetical protein